jgi:putative addiction module component (TIGR02574 family)
MSVDLEVLEAEALKLSAQERARLVDRLIASLSDDADVDEAWAAEVERRIAEVEAGRVSMVPAVDVIARARRVLTGSPCSGSPDPAADPVAGSAMLDRLGSSGRRAPQRPRPVPTARRWFWPR